MEPSQLLGHTHTAATPKSNPSLIIFSKVSAEMLLAACTERSQRAPLL